MTLSHRHNDLELNLVEGGAITYFFGGRRFIIPAGTLVLFWAIAPHQLVEVEGDCSVSWLTVPLNWFLHRPWPEAFRRAVTSCELVFDRAVRPFEQEVFRLWQDDLYAARADQREIVFLEVEARLRRLALQMETGSPVRASLAGSAHAQAEAIAGYLAGHYLDEVRVEEVAAQVGLHPNYAMTVFRKIYGQTVIEYLTHLRIAHAQQLLVNAQYNMLEVAMRSGFGSVSQFYTLFKRTCGMPPRVYRESLQ